MMQKLEISYEPIHSRAVLKLCCLWEDLLVKTLYP